MNDKKVPYLFEDESKAFSESVFHLIDAVKQLRLSPYISKENTNFFFHGGGWQVANTDADNESNYNELQIEVSIKNEQIRLNDIQGFIDFIEGFAGGMADEMMKGMFSTLNEACDKSGNVVKHESGKTEAESFKEAIEKIQFSVDKQGQVQLPSVVVSPDNKLLEHLHAQDEGFRQEIDEIIERKSKEALQREEERLNKFKGYKK